MFLGIGMMILTGLSWIITGIVMGRAPKENIIVDSLIFMGACFSVAVGTATGCFSGFPAWSGMLPVIAGCMFLGGIFCGFQLFFMSRAMQIGPNGVVWSLVQSAFAAPFLVGVICFRTPASLWRWLGFGAAVMSVLLIGFLKSSGKSRYGNWKTTAFLSFVMTAILQVLCNMPSYFPESGSVSSVWRSTFCAGGTAAGIFFFYAFRCRLSDFRRNLATTLRRKKAWQLCLLMQSFSLGSSYLLLYPGMDLLADAGAGAIAYPLMVGSCLIGFEVYSVAVLRETRSFLQWLMLLLCLSGVVLLIF